MLDEPHAAIPGPAALVVVADDIVVRGVQVGTEVALDKISRLICRESEKDVESVNVARVQPNRMTCLRRRVAVLQEIIRHLRRSCHLTRTLQAKN